MQGYKGKISIIVASALSLILLFAYLQAQSSEAPSAASSASNDDQLVVVAVGDIMMGSIHPSNKLPPEDGKGIFGGVREKLVSGDIVFGNLEGPLIDQGVPKKCTAKLPQCYEFVTPTRYVNHLRDAGFNVMNIANNHTFDCGVIGVESSITTLKTAGIEATGGATIGRLQRKGKRIVVAGFSFTLSDHAYSIHDIDVAKNIINKLKEGNDIVIVSFHGGSEGKSAIRTLNVNERFLGEHRGNVVKFSRAVVDAGADLVLGHGPHVLRAMEVYKGKLIAYSLGNFLTYKMFNVKGVNGLSAVLTVRMNLDTGKFIGGHIVPLKLTDEGVPEIDPRREALKLLKNLIAEDFRQNALVIDGTSGALSLAH